MRENWLAQRWGRHRPAGARPRGVGNGFTLVELLVSVAIIATLIGILLPALGSARKSAGLAVCLSNMKQITAGASMYAEDQPDGMWPVVPSILNRNSGYVSFDSWRYGGKTTDTFWKTYASGVSYMTVSQRLINKHLYPDITLKDTPDALLELEVFRCPSDPGTYQRGSWYSNPPKLQLDGKITCYDDVGTSYQLNTKWFRVARQKASTISPRPTSLAVYEATKFMFRSAGASQPSRFVWLHDQTMDVASITGVIAEGDHGPKMQSTAGFMDGHAKYVTAEPLAFNTPQYLLELGSEAWFQQLGGVE
jgi:prepilin-type N-terminal cleavage/methylation domain-containing protein